MIHDFSIQYNSVHLRPLEIEDALLLRELRNRNSQYFFTDKLITEEQQIQWYANYSCKPGDYMFAISPVSDPTSFWGAIGIYGVDDTTGIAESGRVIVDRDRIGQKGIGSLAIRAAAMIAFEQLNIRKLVARIMPDNISSIRAHEKAGYSLSRNDQHSLVFEINSNKYSEVNI